MKTILAVTNDLDLVHAVRMDLRKVGCRVVSAEDGPMAIARVRQQNPDFIFLDLELLSEHGLTVCERLRQTSAVPILVLTSRLEHAEQAIGQKVGADDFAIKPVDASQMAARIQSLLRWAEKRDAAGSTLIRAGAWNSIRRTTVLRSPANL